ncbi:MAG: alpha/beta hydrolase family protein [Oscillospiraceae bacterium]|jgi:hypothetical protein|nr:alpha/beta hydrolase family protein [Oscillospiraceae bacterium]
MVFHPNIPNDNGFLTSLEQMKDLFIRRGCRQRFTGETPDELKAWQAESRMLLKSLLGFNTFEKCDNNLYELERVELSDHIRFKYVLQTEEKVFVPLYALIPADMKPGEKRPVVICPNGHFARAKESVAAVREEENVLQDIETFNLMYGEDFVKMGYIAFCPDARGFGERAEKARQPEGEWKCSCTFLNRMGIPLGRSALGMNIWDLVKLTDYIETRDDCDSASIGCAGLSGGGMQSLFLAAVDERIRCICTSGYFYGVFESLLIMNENCDCNYVPDLWKYFDMGDIAALLAPRALIIETGDKDTLNGESNLDNISPQFAIAQSSYDVLGCKEKVVHTVFDGGHLWYGRDIYPFFSRFLPIK